MYEASRSFGGNEKAEQVDVEVNEVSAGVRSGNDSTQVVGSADIFDENGEIRLIPMPSSNPKDPLNMTDLRKWTAIGVLCFFGSLALSAEIIIGSLIPIFLLEYAGLDPRTIQDINFVAASGGQGAQLNPLAVIPAGVTPPSLTKVSMLATIPLITNGIASYFLVPLSIAIGRRPVLLLTAVLAWAGGLWAGLSSSLDDHLAARAVMGLGAGAVEALIPLIVQDMVFIHQRNKAQSAIVASQGVVLIALGIAAPYVSANYNWRYLYYATSGAGIVAWFLLIALLPETRWTRSKEMLAGRPEEELVPGEKRPRLDFTKYGPRDLWTNIGLFNAGFEWKNAAVSMLNTLRTTLFPAVVWSVLANAIFLIANQAAQQLGSFVLLAQGWEFQWTGLSVIPFVLATVVVFFLSGPVADKVTTTIAKRRNGVREAEFGLANMLIPFIAGISGCFIFGYAGQSTGVPWIVLLLGMFLIVFGFLCIMITINVFVVESYPQWAGPVLVNVSSLRIVIAFFLASLATTWVAEEGLLPTFVIYAEVMIVLVLLLPVLWVFGKRIRVWTAGRVRTAGLEEKMAYDTESRWSE
ncbi:hypothetical protein M406DRAFT_50918 [Cryphonectria parasitica EP155]|uniref:Major facilitator superfamily (MFS) profile domain-containing protein n=1 Tax=Cryphonectria parasitica (strain ATCC 38755 / EP155) TaxID=660469 RepID=A0A9P4XVM0_CRYP1|nr:uncharacterized protein M406DRAFT_50918 [Cryphonectria parasitica EP155]KAF3761622.1 hypothetical protein M406DRAFT_50918 [Cryphonectria parasitica EP155]